MYLSANIDLTSWWKAYVNAGLNYARYSNDFSGYILNNEGAYGTVHINTDITLPARLKLELSGSYMSTLPAAVLTQHPVYRMDAGMTSLFSIISWI